jgi:hypothetical protein
MNYEISFSKLDDPNSQSAIQHCCWQGLHFNSTSNAHKRIAAHNGQWSSQMAARRKSKEEESEPIQFRKCLFQ